MPELQAAYLWYPMATQERPGSDFRMSQLRDFTCRAPQLTELAIHRNPPIFDIDSVYAISAVASSLSSDTSSTSPMGLRALTWTAAPPKDIWRLFYVLAMPKLFELVLTLDSIDRRWLCLSGDTSASLGTQDTLSCYALPQVVQLLTLSRLCLECKDADALSVALRRFSFPFLERLTLSYSGPESSHRSPMLPSIGKIFREPRLAKLVDLELRCFRLDAETVTTLAYTQSLARLSIYNCTGADVIICALSGNACDHQGAELPVKWLCPNLKELRLSYCSAVKFKCLEAVVRQRKADSIAVPTMPARAIRPLKRSVLAGPRSPATPKKIRMPFDGQEASASPNGSFVDGWRAHEVTRPTPICTVHVLGCKRISRAELFSLKDDEYGVESMSWCE
ncbi:uncharacterized protein PHACADRAFT_191702 [Phanerochaete carnosa HHB-10118-sp]|uniref:F-box domain-containing protein n=1 Tax=Phanerochaete carnosa (strain HHB-10118-sp) TaxID=650164 RepID=K5WJR7_PHACS|nr:uncharacterized protein PHACADRAFT_191702 [Phanerochaete carnosa HHB-10118-sp]EKM59354.1 hypothetical protein PHACADRAFT_191702 [Phanerochaete carnosa HHB-10118-sp]